MNKQEIITQLEELPKKIYEIRKEILEAEEELELLKNTYEEIELKTTDLIETMIDDKGKKVFSNETKRLLELKRRLQNNQEYNNNLLEYKNKRLDNKRMIIELGLAQDQLKSTRSIVMLWNEGD